MRVRRRRPLGLVLALSALLVAAACGGGDGEGTGSTAPPQPDDLQAQVASFDLAVGGPSRVIVGVLSFDQRFLVYGSVRLRFAYLGTTEAPRSAEYGPPVDAGFLPIPGVVLPTPVPTQPRLVPGSEARGVYAGRTAFDRAGFWEAEVSAVVDGSTRTATSAFEVLADHLVPVPGQPALATENLTVAAGADVPRPAIDSRFVTANAIPDPELHSSTVAAALAAGRPAVVVFATPVYCQSQFCGPVTDLVSELADEYGDRASFVHIEIWRDFGGQVINKAAADWLLHEAGLNEPWVFLIGADGAITHRFDNVATRSEMEPVLAALPVIGPAA